MLAYGRRIPKAEMFARIDAVDADTVRAVADRFIYDQVRHNARSDGLGVRSKDEVDWRFCRTALTWPSGGR